jgi:hypothetical protein
MSKRRLSDIYRSTPTSPEAVLYLQRRRRYINRRLAIAGWHEGLYRAYKRDTAKLSAYLRSDLPLDNDKEKRDQLADLIDRLIGRRSGVKGRKPGHIPPQRPDTITTPDVVYYARRELQRIKQLNGGKVPRGTYRAVVEDVCRHFGEQDGVECNMEQALQMLRRGQPRNHR